VISRQSNLFPLRGKPVEDGNGWAIDVGENMNPTRFAAHPTAELSAGEILKSMLYSVDSYLVFFRIDSNIRNLGEFSGSFRRWANIVVDQL
jgi:hypothetical protein